MLSYAFQVLKQQTYEEIATEDFEYVEDLLAAILILGLSRQVKQGLYREYIENDEDTISPHGKIDISGTIKNYNQRRKYIHCEYDELSIDNPYNQVIKTTLWYLLRLPNVKRERKDLIKKNLCFFDSVKSLSPLEIRWDALRFTKNNQEYRMLLNICNFILEGLILTTEKGSKKVISHLDERKMHELYEKFILGYYRFHYPELHANPDWLDWDTDDGFDEFLPRMKTDITLKYKGKTLIIDAKYYENMMTSNFDIQSYRSANLYQIYTYVKNWDKKHTGDVAGMLLYAKTSESIQPNSTYLIAGNQISVKTLDLNQPFSQIASALNRIADEYFYAKKEEQKGTTA